MEQKSNEQKLTIVSIDLFGYSRLMEEDEQGTHRALMACRRNVLEPTVEEFGGNVIKSTGDGALLSFPTPETCIDGMVAFQHRVAEREAEVSERRQLIFRVGIHLTETIREDGDLYGHGVNLAVRLQEAAEPGSIYISDTTVQALENTTKHSPDYVGQHRLKNLMDPIPIYCLRSSGSVPKLKSMFFYTQHRRLVATAAAGLMVLLFSFETMLEGGVYLKEQPSVLLNQKARTEVESKINPNNIPHLKDWGRHYLLASQIQSDEGNIRIQSRPRERLVGIPGWADILEELNPSPVSSSVDGEPRSSLSSSPSGQASQRSLLSRNEIADDLYAQAWMSYRRHNPHDFRNAWRILRDVLILNPRHDSGHALLAAVYWTSWQNRWPLGTGYPASRTLKLAQDHLNAIQEPKAMAHVVISEMLTASGYHEEAIVEAERAMLLEPSMAIGYYAKGMAVLFDGRPDKAEGLIQTAINLDPKSPRYLFGLAFAWFQQERFKDAYTAVSRGISANVQDDWPYLLLAATSGHLRHFEAARDAIHHFDRLSVPRRGWFANQIPYVYGFPFKSKRDQQRLHEGMILAGIPVTVHLAAR